MNHKDKASREQHWKKHVARYSGTSMTQREYCRKNDINYWTFNTWKRKLSEKNCKGSLVEIPAGKVRDIPCIPLTIELEINRSLKINLSQGFDPELLTKVVSTLGIDI